MIKGDVWCESNRTYLVAHLTPKTIIGLSQWIRLLSVQGVGVVLGVLAGETTSATAFTSFAFTITIVITKEVITITTSELFANLDWPQYLDTGSGSARRYKFTIRPTIMIDISGRAEPQLSTVLSTRVHHWKVVQSGLENLLLFLDLIKEK